jgi:hypothetical protein
MKLISGSCIPANNRAEVITETARGSAHLGRETLGQSRLKDCLNINAFRLFLNIMQRVAPIARR